jgi:polysaccharide export outer membrane protein
MPSGKGKPERRAIRIGRLSRNDRHGARFRDGQRRGFVPQLGALRWIVNAAMPPWFGIIMKKLLLKTMSFFNIFKRLPDIICGDGATLKGICGGDGVMEKLSLKRVYTRKRINGRLGATMNSLRMPWRRFAAGLLLGLLGALSTIGATAQSVAPTTAAAPAPVTDGSYRLGPGDTLRVTVYGQPDMSGDFQISDNGFADLPLIGQVKAAGTTISEFSAGVTKQLADGYLLNPKVSVEVTNYRPFYIMGEVNKPGGYPFVSGMTILNAVVLAGGFTYRADDSKVVLHRKGSDKDIRVDANDATIVVNPGDIITVKERFF